jgi:predicted methyltransferase
MMRGMSRSSLASRLGRYSHVSAIYAVILAGCANSAAPPPAPLTPASAPAPSAPAAAPTSATPLDAQAVVAAADRSEPDRALDAGRKPAELLTFCGVAPGMRVLDLAAGGGYTTELLARAVGKSGTVYGENPKAFLSFVGEIWSNRLSQPAMSNVVRVDAEPDADWPAAVKDLDLVTLVLVYHDSVWQGTDRARMNQNVLHALKPGGKYVVLDHSAKAGDGTSVVKTLHRIEESLVKDEITKAGFVLDAESEAWREPSDTRDWSASPKSAGEKRGHSDRFALRFRKP